MPDILNVIKGRKTTYEFSERPVPPGDLDKVLEAARWAPSSHNSQNWSFVVVRDSKAVSELLKLCYYGDFHTPPNVIVAIVMEPLSPKSRKVSPAELMEFAKSHQYMNMGMPVMAMILEAHSLGIQSCILSPRVNEANKALQVPGGRQAMLFVGLGYEKEKAFQKQRERKEKNEITFTGKYGQK